MSGMLLELESGLVLSPRHVTVSEHISEPFSVEVTARASQSARAEIGEVVGRRAAITLKGALGDTAVARTWRGVCTSVELAQAEEVDGSAIESTFLLTIVPQLWLLSQRTNYRVYQQQTVKDIVSDIFTEWGINFDWHINETDHPKLDYCVQYGESDLQFVERMLEEAGIAYLCSDEKGSEVVALHDHLQESKARAREPLTYLDSPGRQGLREYATNVSVALSVQPGALAIRDYDFRRPAYALLGEANKAQAPEDRYELFHYQPGSFVRVDDAAPSDTPAADDRHQARHHDGYGAYKANIALDAERVDRRRVSFESGALTLWPGVVFQIDQYPHPELTAETKLLLTEYRLDAEAAGDWLTDGDAVFTDVPYRPQPLTPKPVATGVQTAVVVGPPGEEVHTDEYGRVRVQFPWDRLGDATDKSSCWVRVSQGWAGVGFGFINLPRVGQEVLVAFLEGDPDQPMVVGRVFNQTQPVPYKLPQHKTRSTWKSCSSPGADGFNELMFEDLKGKELVYIQAERNLRRLVKNDEIVTIGRDYQRQVKGDELLVTAGTRTELTRGDRRQRVDGNDTTVVGGRREQLVNQDDIVRVDGSQRSLVNKTRHLVVGGDRRDRIDGDDDLIVKGARREQVGKDASLLVKGDNHVEVHGRHALSAAEEIHLCAGESLVVEAGLDLTIKAAGGFIRITPMGVTIKGTLVQINSGGTQAGSGQGVATAAPKEAASVTFDVAQMPEVDDVSINGLNQ